MPTYSIIVSQSYFGMTDIVGANRWDKAHNQEWSGSHIVQMFPDTMWAWEKQVGGNGIFVKRFPFFGSTLYNIRRYVASFKLTSENISLAEGETIESIDLRLHSYETPVGVNYDADVIVVKGDLENWYTQSINDLAGWEIGFDKDDLTLYSDEFDYVNSDEAASSSAAVVTNNIPLNAQAISDITDGIENVNPASRKTEIFVLEHDYDASNVAPGSTVQYGANFWHHITASVHPDHYPSLEITTTLPASTTKWGDDVSPKHLFIASGTNKISGGKHIIR